MLEHHKLHHLNTRLICGGFIWFPDLGAIENCGYDYGVQKVYLCREAFKMQMETLLFKKGQRIIPHEDLGLESRPHGDKLSPYGIDLVDRDCFFSCRISGISFSFLIQ